MAQAAKSAGVRHVIWSTLEDTRKRVPLSTTACRPCMEQLQGAALRRQGRGRPLLPAMPACRRRSCSPRSTGTTSSTSAWAAKPVPDGALQFTLPMGDAKLAGHRGGGHRQVALRHLQGGRAVRRQARRRRRRAAHGRARWPRRCRARSAARSATTRSRPEAYRGFGFPGADDLGNMFQYYRDFERGSAGRATSTFSRELNPALLSVRRVAREEQGPHSAGLIAAD